MNDVDDEAVERLRTLRDQVARPGEDVLGELLRLFAEDSDLRVTAIARGRGSEDEVRRAAHALKGSAANLGAQRVAALAYAIERDPSGISDAQIAELAAAVERAVEVLRERLR